MSHPLDSAYLKLVRAVEHLEQTEAETQRFVESNPYVPIVDYDFESMEHLVRIRVIGEPPMRLGLLAGDTIHNLRSALDHLIYQLAALDPDTARGDKTQYPIFDDPEKFDAMPTYYLEGVPDRYRAMLRTAQPYNPRYALLGPLARLDNRDKHRLVEPIAGSTLMATLYPDPPDSIYDIRGADRVVYFEDGAVLARFRSYGHVTVEVRDFTYYIRFGPQAQVGLGTDGMRLLVDRIAEILASFRAAFD